jgi:hypothetical protein
MHILSSIAELAASLNCFESIPEWRCLFVETIRNNEMPRRFLMIPNMKHKGGLYEKKYYVRHEGAVKNEMCDDNI